MSGSARHVVLVDGSNVAHSDAWAAVVRREQGEVPHANHRLDSDPRARLLDWILAWTTHSGADVVVVFDGEGPLGAGRTQWNHAYLVIGSGTDDGDRVVEREAERLHRERVAYRLVTDDHALANVAGVHAEVVHDTAHFVAELSVESVDTSPGERSAGAGGDAPTRLGDTVDADTWSALERLRRGE